jgi:hypothetical protein
MPKSSGQVVRDAIRASEGLPPLYTESGERVATPKPAPEPAAVKPKEKSKK